VCIIFLFPRKKPSLVSGLCLLAVSEKKRDAREEAEGAIGALLCNFRAWEQGMVGPRGDAVGQNRVARRC